MTNVPLSIKKRIDSIDVLRGIVMVIMAIDHIRDNFHIYANTDDPLNLATTSPGLFMTRWITHFCAPVFVFLSGTSIYLQSLRKTPNELSSFLLKRGLWLVLAELLIVSIGITFLPWNLLILQVIWAIGISMVCMALLTRLPFNVILALGLLIVLGHNALDFTEKSADFNPGFWWEILHHGHMKFYGFDQTHGLLIVYPFMPWLGLMLLGYCSGILFKPEVEPARRKKILLYMGGGILAFFLVLRMINMYGDPVPWAEQKSGLLTVFSFINVFKYPPSLLYMCLFIGPSLILLALIEPMKNWFTDIMRIFGRTAFFYYIIHWFVIHGLAGILFFINGHTFAEAIASARNLPFLFILSGEGVSLPFIYLIWITVIIALYPLCKKYDQYKTAHKEKWWLSYL